MKCDDLKAIGGVAGGVAVLSLIGWAVAMDSGSSEGQKFAALLGVASGVTGITLYSLGATGKGCEEK